MKDRAKKHPEFIGFGIELYVEKSKEKEVVDSKQAEDEKEVEEEVGAEKGNEEKKKENEKGERGAPTSGSNSTRTDLFEGGSRRR